METPSFPFNVTMKPESAEEKNRPRSTTMALRAVRKRRNPVETLTVEKKPKNVISINGNNFIDTNGGFLLEEQEVKKNETPIQAVTFDDINIYICMECDKEFFDSYLQVNFDYLVCDACRDQDEKHTLITKTDARSEYLLKDCDFDLREPPLRFISRKNPHNPTWGDMKLYLLPQIEMRALEVWGSWDKLKEAHKAREEKQVVQKVKKYEKKLKDLRKTVRSSVYNRTHGPSHQHEFGEEVYNEDEDNYSKSCKTCPYKEVFEKM